MQTAKKCCCCLSDLRLVYAPASVAVVAAAASTSKKNAANFELQSFFVFHILQCKEDSTNLNVFSLILIYSLICSKQRKEIHKLEKLQKEERRHVNASGKRGCTECV